MQGATAPVMGKATRRCTLHPAPERTMHVPWNTTKPVEVMPGLTRRTLATGRQVMLVEFRAQKDVNIPIHNHPHEQDGYLVAGEMVITINGVDTTVRPGDSYAIPGNTPHGARLQAGAIVLEAFSPPREDYR